MKRLMMSCDWGTTSFRLRLLETESRLLINEVISDDGASKLYSQWQKNYDMEAISREHFYLTYLHHQIKSVTRGCTIPLAEIPIFISGMACSSIGMKELPYATTPFVLNGNTAIVHRLEENYFQLNVFMISGVSHESDVMRGEETQLIGLNELEPEFLNRNPICILPGTHSKHVYIQNGKMVDFKTFMTGELFEVISRHSILKSAITSNSKAYLSNADMEPFRKGVRQAKAGNLLNTLFSVRMNKLFGSLNEEQNFLYLSGLLIGAELSSLTLNSNQSIVLCSSSNVYSLYREALTELGLSGQTSFVSPEIMNNAAVEGHLKMLKNNINFLKAS